MRSWVRRYGIQQIRLDGVAYVSERAVMDCEYLRRRDGSGRKRRAAA